MKNKIKLSLLDRTVGYFSPKALNNRLIEKARTEILSSRTYDAAVSNPQNILRKVSNSASKEVGSQTNKIKFNVRNQIQNNPVAVKGLQTIVNATIGWGIEASITHGKRQTEVDKLWKLWTKNCSLDGSSFSALQALVMAALVQDGEVLIKKNITHDGFIKLQVLECDYLVTGLPSALNLKKGETFANGIVRDEFKRPVSYLLYKSHPGDGVSNEIEIVPSNDLIHLFRKDRPEQDRGISWFAQALHSIGMLDELLWTQLVRLKLSASVTAIVTQQPNSLNPELVQQQRTDQWELIPGTVQYISPGESVEFPSIPNPDGFDSVTKQTMRLIASALGITYEALSGDLTQVNFSSAKIGDIQFRQNVEFWRWNLFIPVFLDSAFECFKKYCALNGIDTTEMTVEWVPPQRMLLDAKAEIDATSEAIRNGLMTYQGALRELGYNPKLHVKEIAESNKMLDEAGIIIDSDPRRVSSAGQLQSVSKES